MSKLLGIGPLCPYDPVNYHDVYTDINVPVYWCTKIARKDGCINIQLNSAHLEKLMIALRW
jgi:hypothetical protein